MRKVVEEIYRSHTSLKKSKGAAEICLMQGCGDSSKIAMQWWEGRREDLRRAGRGNEAFLVLTTV